MSTLSIINLIVNIINIIFIGILLYIGIQIFKHMPKDPDGSDGEYSKLSSNIQKSLNHSIPYSKLDKEPKTFIQQQFPKEHETQLHHLVGDEEKTNGLKEAKKQSIQNHDYSCIPAVNSDHLKNDKSVKSENCISKNLPANEAYDACISSSDANNSCNLIHSDKTLAYQKELCGDNYYCAVNNANSCNYEICDLREKQYSFGNQSICQCQKSKDDKNLKYSWQGRMCEKGQNCSEYKTYRKPVELFNFPDLKCWYDACSGPPSWMNVPNIKNRLESKILEAQAS